MGGFGSFISFDFEEQSTSVNKWVTKVGSEKEVRSKVGVNV
jgi:hypothetical protein